MTAECLEKLSSPGQAEKGGSVKGTSSSATLVGQMRHTEGVWRVFLWFVLELAGAAVVASVIIFSLRQTPAIPPDSSDGQIRWVPVVVDAPGTSGAPRIRRRVDPKAVRQGLEAVPQKDLGQIVFNPPEHMIVGQEEPIDAAITLGDVKAAIEQFIGKGKVTEAELRVASRMRVKLFGDDFRIKERSTEEQSISIDKAPFEATLWRWDLTPLRPGRLPLKLRATRIMAVPKDGDVPRDLLSFERTIVVKADLWYSVGHWTGDNKTWVIPLAVSLAIPACGRLIYKLRRRKRRRRQRPNTRFRPYRRA